MFYNKPIQGTFKILIVMLKLKVMFLLLAGVLFSIHLQAAGDVEVQYVAIHYGNAVSDVINEASFPAFTFYNAVGEVTGYTEKQKIIGNPTYLSGWYGAVPEKMAFSANYRGEYSKSEGFPYEKGAIYVLDKNGTVAYQLPPEKFNDVNYRDKYDAVFSDIKNAIRKLSRGKEEKVVKENKRKYIKSSPVGEREAVKGSKTDNKVDGIVGWPVPDLTLTDGGGNSVQLQQLAEGKVTVLVFYSLNGVTWKRGDTDGNIIEEGEENPLVSNKAGAHKFFTQHLEMVQALAE